MENNAQPPAQDNNVPRQPSLVIIHLYEVLAFLTGLIAAYIYLNWVVPMFSVVTFPQPDFQNSTATYYDVLNISHNATSSEIFQAYDYQLNILKSSSSAAVVYAGTINFTTMAKIGQTQKAYDILSGGERCLYDFEALGLGVIKYLRCVLIGY
ncbi:hypothetical protein F5Y03DRAFT_408068 [Xylaria venustula]|nr:hypothetical protein F5Y03DRAFT_408068 [Xylaria venustula]